VSEQNKFLVREFLSAVDRKDFDAAEAYLAPAARTEIAGQPGPLDSRAYRQFGEMFARSVPDGQHTIVEQMAEGDRVVTRATYTGTQRGELMGVPPTGRRVSVGAVMIDRIAEGKIAERYIVFDALTMLQQLGAIPVPEQAAA
jgi:steroid delta-isomerase-like uncharacterized protein